MFEHQRQILKTLPYTAILIKNIKKSIISSDINNITKKLKSLEELTVSY